MCGLYLNTLAKKREQEPESIRKGSYKKDREKTHEGRLPEGFIRFRRALSKTLHPEEWSDDRILVAFDKIYKELKSELPSLEEELENIGVFLPLKRTIRKLVADTRYLYLLKKILAESNLEGRYLKHLSKEETKIVFEYVDHAIERAVKSVKNAIEDVILLGDAERAFENTLDALKAHNDLEKNISEKEEIKALIKVIEEKKTLFKEFFAEDMLPLVKDKLYMQMTILLNYPAERFYEKGTLEGHLPGQLYRVLGLVLEETVKAAEKEGKLSKDTLNTVWQESIEEKFTKLLQQPEIFLIPAYVHGDVALDNYLRAFFKGDEEVEKNISWMLAYIYSLRQGMGLPPLNAEYIGKEIGLSPEKALEKIGIANEGILETLERGGDLFGKKSKEREEEDEEEEKREKNGILTLFGDMMREINRERTLYFFPQEILLARDMKSQLLTLEDVRVFSLFSVDLERSSVLKFWRSSIVLKNISDKLHLRLRGIDTTSPFEAFTNGEEIYVTPFYTYFPTYPLNQLAMLSVITHETRHIKYGSFRFPYDPQPTINFERYEERIPTIMKSLAEKEGVSVKELKEELEEIERAFEKIFDKFYRKIKKDVPMQDSKETIEKTGMSLREAKEYLLETTVKELEKLNLKILGNRVEAFAYLISSIVDPQTGATMFDQLQNIVEDYRIDNLFMEDPDGVRDPFLNFIDIGTRNEEEKLAAFRMGYDLGKYLLLRRAMMSVLNAKASQDVKDNFNFLVSMLLAYSKTGPVMKALLKDEELSEREREIFAIMDAVMEKVLPRDEKGNMVRKMHGKDSWEATFEAALFFTLIASDTEEMGRTIRDLKDKLKNNLNKPERKSGKSCNKSGRGQSRESQGSRQKSGEKSEDENKEKGKGDKGKGKGDEEEENEERGGAEQENRKGEEKSEEGGSEEESEGDELNKEEEKSEEPDPGKDDMKKGEEGELERLKPEERKTKYGEQRGGPGRETAEEVEAKYEISVTIPRSSIEMYKEALKEVKVGTITPVKEWSKISGRPNERRILEFIYSKGMKSKTFFQKKKLRIDEKKGHYLFQRPITMYLVVDVSGSMDLETNSEGKLMDDFMSSELAKDKEGHTVKTRARFALYNNLAILTAYKELLEEGNIDKDILNVEIIGVANSGDKIVIKPSDIRIESSGKKGDVTIKMPNPLELTGGTDLGAMMKSAVETIKENEKRVKEEFLEGIRRIALTPNILFIFWTDFGDWGGNVEEGLKAIAQIALQYNEDSELIGEASKYINAKRASVGVIFISPDNRVDENAPYEKIKEYLGEDYTLILYNSDDAPEHMKKLMGVYRSGEAKATNVHIPSSKEE